MTMFNARDHLALLLACEPATLSRTRGPLDGYRGAEADYSRAGQVVGTVLVGPPSIKAMGRGTNRTVTTRTRTELRRSSIDRDADVNW